MKQFIFYISLLCFVLFGCKGNKEKSGFTKDRDIVLTGMNIGEELGRVKALKSLGDYLVVVEKNVDTQLQLDETEDVFRSDLGNVLQ